MQKEEMLAEKVRALLYGNHARDVYDLWFLLKKGTNVDKSLIDKKLGLYSKDRKLQDFNIAEEIEKERKKWELEMNILTKTLPTFEEAKETILDALS
jgi:predicted nucleotidyltransferase component of viral defense system